MSILFYDCEIIKMIPSKFPLNDPNYHYCDGWTDYANMGISVIGTYSTLTKRYQAYSGFQYHYPIEWFQDFAPLHSIVVGFNSSNFDDHLMAANNIPIKTTYDLLSEIRLAAFGSTRWQDTPKGCSYSLGRLAEAHGSTKTGAGELAPKLWQDDKKQEVIDYCLNDVRLTVQLFELGIEGKLLDPNTGRYLKLKEPQTNHHG